MVSAAGRTAGIETERAGIGVWESPWVGYRGGWGGA